MQRPPSALPNSTHQRLLAAAATVFARDGLAGSTTREIARQAGVNEVTLFRHFRTKDRLISAVVGKNFGTEAASQPAEAATGDLRADLLDHARRYERLLRDNISLIRTMIGEIQHHADHERQVFKAIFRPLREALLLRLRAAMQEGKLRSGIDPEILTDLFAAMIFTGVLRRTSKYRKIDYSPANYLAAAVDLLVDGAAPR